MSGVGIPFNGGMQASLQPLIYSIRPNKPVPQSAQHWILWEMGQGHSEPQTHVCERVHTNTHVQCACPSP